MTRATGVMRSRDRSTGIISAQRTLRQVPARPTRTRDSCGITCCVHDAKGYTIEVLQSFGDRDTERVWLRVVVRKFHGDLQRVALRKLVILDAAETIGDLRVPPGNRLDKLSGDRAGQYSIRINDQWRICFRWTKAGPEEVMITDYH